MGENGVKVHMRGRRNDGFQLKMRRREVIKQRGGERKGGKTFKKQNVLTGKYKGIPCIFHVWNQPCGSENHMRHENIFQKQNKIIFFFLVGLNFEYVEEMYVPHVAHESNFYTFFWGAKWRDIVSN